MPTHHLNSPRVELHLINGLSKGLLYFSYWFIAFLFKLGFNVVFSISCQLEKTFELTVLCIEWQFRLCAWPVVYTTEAMQCPSKTSSTAPFLIQLHCASTCSLHRVAADTYHKKWPALLCVRFID